MLLCFRKLKKPFTKAFIFLTFFSCYSCQNLKHKNSNSFHSKNKSLLVKKSDHNFLNKPISSPVIDKNYFQVQADTAYLKGEKAFFEEKNTKALFYFKKALLFVPESLYLQKRIAKIYEEEELSAEAFNYYQKLSNSTKGNQKYQKKLSEIYISNDLNKKALGLYKQMLTQDPNNFLLWFQQALLLVNEQELNKALNSLKMAESLNINSQDKARILLAKAYIFLQLQDLAQSEKTIQDLFQVAIYEEDLALKIANFYKGLNKPLIAIDLLNSFQKTQGVTENVSKALLNHHIFVENWDETLQQIQELQDMGHLEEKHYSFVVMLFMEKRMYNQALVFLKDLINKEPHSGQYLFLLGFIYEQKQDPLKALNTYNQIKETSPHFLIAKLQTAQILKQIGRKKEALVLLKKISFSNRDISPQALLLYAGFLWEEEQKREALAVLTKGLDVQPFHADILFLRGLYLKKIGRKDLAVKDMNRILMKQKNHTKALNFIASIYSELKTNLNEAESLARKAVLLEPNSIYFLNTLGWILFQKGHLHPALAYLNKAFLHNKKDSHIAKRLAQVHFKLKNFDKSNYFFRESLKLEYDDKNLEKSKAPIIPKQALMH